ncbi:haloacid dehalogenase-like hydrolase domain-containing protein 3 isoform X2 [Penaeus vannamei]|uniref:haloacid dehalogenase-like hydrolase domain-containing protein 3 isoform X2 n=1 Tax=Penaeus vannamei TaxID=6689 RepID=UPI00387F9D1A
MLRLITLDANNTLLKFRTSPGEQYAAVAKLYGIDADPKRLTNAFGSSFKKQENISPNFGASCIGWQNWWLSVVKDTFHGADYHADDKTLTSVGYHLLKHFSTSNPYELFDGTIPFLEKISNRTSKLGVISNSDDRLDEILRQLGVRHYFDFVLCSYNVKVAKPDPEIFQHALVAAGGKIKPSEALHIGDDLQRDYLGARASGWQSFLVRNNYPLICEKGAVVPDQTSMFTSLQELLPAIEHFTKVVEQTTE